MDNPVDAGPSRPLPSGIRTGADARVTRSARGTGRPGREPDRPRKTEIEPTVRADADAGSGAARTGGTRTTGGVSWTDRASRSRRAFRTPQPLPPAYDDALDAGLADLGLTLSPTARAAIDGHARLLLAWTAAINLTAIRDPAAVARRTRRRQPDRAGRPPRAWRRPLHRPRVGRRLPGHPARGGLPGRPGAAPRTGRQEGALPVDRRRGHRARATRSRPPRSAPRRSPPTVATAADGRP